MQELMSLSLVKLTIWIFLVSVLISPVIAFLFTWITNIWFAKKQEYTIDIMKRIVNVIEVAKVEWIDKRNGDNNEQKE